MRIYFLIGSLITLLFACSDSETGEKDIIPEKKMIRIMADVVLAKEIYVQNATEFDKDSIHPVYSVLKSYGTDSAVFYKSLDYYAKRTEEFARMYKQVEQIIQKKKDSLDKTVKIKLKKPPLVKKKDSIPGTLFFKKQK